MMPAIAFLLRERRSRRMDRRTFMSLALSAAASGWRDLASAEEHRVLFWRIETPDNATGIVFGYARAAASVTADIVRDGVRLLEQSSRVLIDMDISSFHPSPRTKRCRRWCRC